VTLRRVRRPSQCHCPAVMGERLPDFVFQRPDVVGQFRALRPRAFAIAVPESRLGRAGLSPVWRVGGNRPRVDSWVERIGYRRRSSTRMLAPTAFSPSSKKPKWYAHQSSEPPCGNAVSTKARAEQRSHRSAAVRVRAGFLSIEVFISAIPSRPSGHSSDTTTIACRFGPVDRVNGPLSSEAPASR